ncbi:MAG: hypothetical protein IKT35_04595 [Clostridia bacterium]|nr:hypothetical protein [Clostridia bacterium]
MTTVCFIGHRKIENHNRVEKVTKEFVTDLIENYNCTNFLFGSKSEFNYICLDILTKLKEIHSNINRIYVRAEYPNIKNDYEDYLLERYEKTIFPKHLENAGKAIYIKRNQYMIDESDICVFFYDNNSFNKKSGTKLALDYAIKKNKFVINIFDNY